MKKAWFFLLIGMICIWSCQEQSLDVSIEQENYVLMTQEGANKTGLLAVYDSHDLLKRTVLGTFNNIAYSKDYIFLAVYREYTPDGFLAAGTTIKVLDRHTFEDVTVIDLQSSHPTEMFVYQNQLFVKVRSLRQSKESVSGFDVYSLIDFSYVGQLNLKNDSYRNFWQRDGDQLYVLYNMMSPHYKEQMMPESIERVKSYGCSEFRSFDLRSLTLMNHYCLASHLESVYYATFYQEFIYYVARKRFVGLNQLDQFDGLYQLDRETGKVLMSVPLTAEAFVMYIDAIRHELYVSLKDRVSIFDVLTLEKKMDIMVAGVRDMYSFDGIELLLNQRGSFTNGYQGENHMISFEMDTKQIVKKRKGTFGPFFKGSKGKVSQ